MFERIERLKSEWTDKYVVVDARAPELARFARATGQVRTVNMNGRCLVEFDQYNNTGWYDIDPAALTVVPKPQPKAAEPKEKAKPAAAKPAAPPKPAPAAKPAAAAAKPAAGAAKLSTAEILARARGAQAAAPATAPPPAPVEEPAEEAATPQPVAPQAKKAAAAGPLPTSTAEKIAWCRAHDARG